MKKRLMMALAICWSSAVVAQDVMQEYLPPSPTVAALAKYVDAPVNLATGTPSIDFPVYEIACRGVKLPISLSYHAGGHRVDEEASWVGLGWSLNAGGVITRTIRHLADNPATRVAFFDDYTGQVLDPVSDYDDLMYLADNPGVDGFPDLYSYNFNGNSGKFINLNGIKLMPKKAIQFAPVTNGWSAVDEHGIQYLFTDVERSKTRATSTITNEDISWYLTRIITPKQDTIKFQYKDTEFYQSVSLSESKRYKQVLSHYDFDGNANSAFTTTCYGKELQKIIFPTGEVEFISEYTRDDIAKPTSAVGALKLVKIVVRDYNQTVVKSVQLLQDYFLASSTNLPKNKRLKLTGIEDEGGAEALFTQFEYESAVNLPAKDSKAKDHWGYFNGKSNSTLVPPLLDNAQIILGNTRDTDGRYSKACVLTKVIFPTRGFTKYDYESHDYSTEKSVTIPSRQERINVVNYLNVATGYTNRSEMSPTTRAIHDVYFDVPDTQDLKINIEIDYPDVYVINSGSQAKIEFYRADIGDPEVLLEDYAITSNGENFLNVTPGRYHIKAIGTMNGGLAHASVEYQDFDLITMKKSFAGGIRVKRITQHDDVNPDMIRVIKYKDPTDSAKSSGDLVAKPYYLSYSYTFEQISSSGGAPIYCSYNEKKWMTISGDSKIPLSPGSHITYANVQVYYGETGQNGWTNTQFTRHPNPAGGANSDQSWRRGVMLEEKQFTAGGVLLQSTTNEYESAGAVQYYGLITSKTGKHPCAQPTGYHNAYPVYFDQSNSIMLSEHWYLKRQTTKAYTGTDFISNLKEYYYDNLVHLQPTREVVSTGQGRQVVTFTSYPDDFQASSGALFDLKTSHVIVPVEKVTWQQKTNGTDIKILSGALYDYKTGGRGLIEAARTLDLASPIPLSQFKFAHLTMGVLPPQTGGAFGPDSRYIAQVSLIYNSVYNPVQVTPNSGVPVSYIWHKLNFSPIAKVQNAPFDRVAFTSFEMNGEGNWNAYSATAAPGRSGVKAFTGTLSKAALPQDNYQLVAWVKDGSPVPTVSAPFVVKSTGDLLSGWRQIIWEGTFSGTLSINATTSIIDDVRLAPSNAMVTSLTHDGLNGPDSSSDVNGNTSFFDFDDFGRLITIRDTKRNIINNYIYHIR